MVVPGNDVASFEWLDQTRQMLASGELRVRHVEYENAPFGHDVRAASAYRWWLGSLAWVVHLVSGQPLGASLETAALFADPLLCGLLLAGVAIFVARFFGEPAAALVSAALAMLYPFAVDFLPGAPGDKGLVLFVGLWSVLPLLVGMQSARRRHRWFALAGCVGGIGLWIGAPSQVPILLGIGLGGLAVAWIARRAPADPASTCETVPWRTWAAWGAATSLAAYLLEYFPSHLGSLDLRAVHPVYGVAWLGGGHALALADRRMRTEGRGWKGSDTCLALLAAVGLAALPLAMWIGKSLGFLASDLSQFHLTRLPDAPAARNLADWIVNDGFSPTVVCTLLPAVLLVPALWLLSRPAVPAAVRMSIALALGPTLVALGFACFELNWWNSFDVFLVSLLVTVTAALWQCHPSRLARGAWIGLVSVVLAAGVFRSFPSGQIGDKNALVESEVVGLIERDLSRWLALHSPPGGGVVLAPTNATAALYYYGGLRGLGTLDWENQQGVQAAVRIVSATSTDEAFDLMTRRGVTFILVPSWDSQLDGFARMGLGQLEGSFLYGLHRWVLPPWLRPVSYPLPVIGGFEGQSIVIFQVTEEQSDALLMSRMAEYMIDSGNLRIAAAAGNALGRFKGDLSALVARAQVDMAQGDAESFSRAVEALLPQLADPDEQSLPMDRRVSLAVVLAQGHHLDLCATQVRLCMAAMDEETLRSLSAASLYHLEVLGKALGAEIPDNRLRQLALDLLPPDVRKKLDR